jgi:hypothetical protein
MLITSLPPLLVNTVRFLEFGRYAHPLAAFPAKNFGDGMSIDLDVERLKMANFRPNSEKMQTSSSLAPKDIDVTLVVSEVGFVMTAENWLFVEYTRIVSPDERSTLLDDSDHNSDCVENDAGKGMTRVVSRDRVARRVSFEGRIVAMYAPSGLGME